MGLYPRIRGCRARTSGALQADVDDHAFDGQPWGQSKPGKGKDRSEERERNYAQWQHDSTGQFFRVSVGLGPTTGVRRRDMADQEGEE